MTTQRIIDNIQTRLETLIGERFTGTYHNIDINCSDYNPDIDTTVTVTITVTDQNDDPVTDYTVPLKIDGTSITGVTTDDNGTATYNYTCNDWGIHKISVKSISAYIDVKGWRLFYNQNGYTGKYNEKYVHLTVNIQGTTFPTNFTEFGIDVLPDSNPDLRPIHVITLPCGANPKNFLNVHSGSRRVRRATTAGSGLSNQSANAEFLWRRKE